MVVALGSNLGDRRRTLLRAIHEMRGVIRVVRISSMYQTDAVDAPPGSPPFLNMVMAGLTRCSPEELLHELLSIEVRLGRVRRGRNAPRTIDLDLIFYSGRTQRTRELTLPHPRYRDREFVMGPLRELGIYPQRVP